MFSYIKKLFKKKPAFSVTEFLSPYNGKYKLVQHEFDDSYILRKRDKLNGNIYDYKTLYKFENIKLEEWLVDSVNRSEHYDSTIGKYKEIK